jgi:adenylate cyclase
VERDASDSFTHATYSTALSVSSADRGQVVLHAQEAVRLNPGAAYAWGALGIANCMIGEFNRGLASLETARQLSPSDMLAYLWLTFEGAANFALEHYDASVVSSRKAMLRNPGYGTAHRLLAASLAQLGQIPEARAVTRRRDLQQTASLAEIRSSGLFHQPGVMDRYVEAQRLCGLT